MDNYRIIYKNHQGKIGTWEGWTDGAIVHSRAAKIIGGKAVPHSYEAKPKNVGRANETTGAEQALLELDSKTRLKIDKGYVRTEAEAQTTATNALGLLKPMLATPFDKVKPEKIDWDSSVVQPKLDGHRALFKDGVLYSRQGKVLEIPHISEAIHESGLADLHLDGELYFHGLPLQQLSRLIKKQTQESLTLQYHVYDIVDDRPFLQRIGELGSRIQDKAFVPAIQPVQTIAIDGHEMLMRYHNEYRNQGYEGTMLRFGADPYGTDRRSRTLLKLKEFHDAEYRVVDVQEGKPYIRGDQSFCVPVWLCETPEGGQFTVTAAGTMHEKHEQWERREEILAQSPLLTVKYHYLSKDGIPQLPVAMRWFETV